MGVYTRATPMDDRTGTGPDRTEAGVKLWWDGGDRDELAEDAVLDALAERRTDQAGQARWVSRVKGGLRVRIRREGARLMVRVDHLDIAGVGGSGVQATADSLEQKSAQLTRDVIETLRAKGFEAEALS